MDEWLKNLATPSNTQNYFTFLFSFKNALAEAITKFGNNIIEKSDSWVNCNIDYLNEKLTKNYNEYYEHGNIDSLTDIVNYALMLLERVLIDQKNNIDALDSEGM